jgi:hypothetical protein
MRYCIAMVRKMKGFIYRSINFLPSGKILVRFTNDPFIAKKFGGVLTCRSSSSVHPNPKFNFGLTARKKYPSRKKSIPPQQKPHEVPTHPISHLS